MTEAAINLKKLEQEIINMEANLKELARTEIELNKSATFLFKSINDGEVPSVDRQLLLSIPYLIEYSLADGIYGMRIPTGAADTALFYTEFRYSLNFPIHNHTDMTEYIWVQKGSIEELYSEQKVEKMINESDCMVIRPGEDHHVIASEYGTTIYVLFKLEK